MSVTDILEITLVVWWKPHSKIRNLPPNECWNLSTQDLLLRAEKDDNTELSTRSILKKMTILNFLLSHTDCF